MYAPIILSSFLYSIGFLYKTLSFTLFFFTIPLFYSELTFFKGVVWGMIAFTLHTHGLFYSVWCMKEQHPLLIFFFSLVLIGYGAIQAGIWFVVIKNSKKWCSPSVHFWIVVPLLHSLFFYYLSYGCLWTFGHFEGYPFLNPLLPLVHIPLICHTLYYLNFIPTLFIVFWISSMAYYIIRKKRYYSLCFLSIIFYFVSMLFIEKPYAPPYINDIMVLPTQYFITSSALFPFKNIMSHTVSSPHASIIVTPESALYNDKNFTDPELSVLNAPHTTFILGSFFYKNEKKYNTLYLIKEGKIINAHYKHHTVMCAESMPFLFKLLPLINTQNVIDKAVECHDTWYLNDMVIKPYICSELFCTLQPPHDGFGTILLSCNDSWFKGPSHYISDLMCADAQFKSLLWHTDIIYIGYPHAWFISHKGGISPITQ